MKNLTSELVEEFRKEHLGCCSGDYCGQGRARGWEHDMGVEQWLKTAFDRVRADFKEEILDDLKTKVLCHDNFGYGNASVYMKDVIKFVESLPVNIAS